MAAAPATASAGHVVISVVPTVQGDATGSEVQQSESISANMVMTKLTMLNRIVFCVALLEWAGNAVGTLAFLWATVVLLGGFSSLLSRMDFWFAMVMIFVEGSRVFIRNDASVNQWLFGSTSAFRWENLSSPRVLAQSKVGRLIAMITGVGISLTPIEFRPKIVASMIKVAILVIISQLLTRRLRRWFAKTVLYLLVVACVIGGIIGSFRLELHYIKKSKGNHIVSYLKILGILTAWGLGTTVLVGLATAIMSCMPFMRKTKPLLCFKIFIASGLACLPFLQVALASYTYKYVSISVAVVLLILSYHEIWGGETSEQQKYTSCGLLLQILETILPILFFWGVMFPLPGISLKISFYMLFAVIAAVLVANLQIPVAFLQILLSIMRLRILLGNHHHDYRPLPPGASPNLVPSIVIFFMMELCQGSSYILAAIFGLISLFRRKSLVRDLKFEQEWGEEAVNLYCRQAYQARKEKGLLPSDNSTPSLTSLAIKPLDSTSSKTQIAGLRVLYNFLERLDPESKKELITDITDVCKKTVAVPNLVDMLGSTVPLDKDIIRLLAASVIAELTGRIKISEFPGMVKLISLVLDYKNRQNSMRPTDSLKISEFPRVEEMMYSLYILSAKNRQNSLPKCVPGNNEGNPNSIRHMIRTADESTLLQRMLFPLLGMSILQRLACDPDNCDEIVEDATYISTKTIGLISYVTNEEISGDPQKALVLRSSLNFVRWLAIDRGKIGSRFRQELSDNPLLLNSLGRILDGDYQPELWEPVVDIIAALALDEAARQDIGSTQSIIPKLMCTFLRQDDVNPIENNDHSLQRAAGEALANLTIKSTENCWAILLAEQGHNLIKKLIDMLDDENCICVAANLLHNLCANSRDKLTDIDLGASAQLEYALPKMMQIIMTSKEGKQLEAALCVISQIGYVIPKCFRKVLTEDTDAAALVEKLLDTLNSNREPCPEYPRIRRVLVETVISIVCLCPNTYRPIFREKKAKDALDMVKGTPSILEKFRVFINGKGVLPESLPMHGLVDKAKTLIYPPAPTMSAEGDHA